MGLFGILEMGLRGERRVWERVGARGSQINGNLKAERDAKTGGFRDGDCESFDFRCTEELPHLVTLILEIRIKARRAQDVGQIRIHEVAEGVAVLALPDERAQQCREV
jgi:hypothetical protein